MDDLDTVSPNPAVVSKLRNLPPFPVVALRLLSLLSDNQSGFHAIAVCIASDPVLAGKVIQRANAADVPSYCELRTVLQAVTVLGSDRTRQTALTLATQGYARKAGNTEAFRAWWRHTVASAMIAAELSRQCGSNAAEAYTATLLHDIGRLGLLTAYPKEYEALLAGAIDGATGLLETERAQFGIDHIQTGGWLAREWKLPPALVSVIDGHHQPPAGEVDNVVVAHVACQLADLLGFSAEASGIIGDLDRIIAPLPEWTRPRVRAQLATVRGSILLELGLKDDLEPPKPPPRVRRFSPKARPSSASVPPRRRQRAGLFAAVIAAILVVAALLMLSSR